MGMLMILCDEFSWLYTYVKIHQIADFKTFCLLYIYSSTKLLEGRRNGGNSQLKDLRVLI